MVWGDPYTKGSQTAKSGTDEQERHMRHINSGKQAHHCNAQNGFKGLVCRCRRDWRKEKAFTRGGLGLDSVFLYTKKSAEAILATGNEPRIETVEDSQRSEGLNVCSSLNFLRRSKLRVYQPYFRISKVLLVKRATILMNRRTAVYETRTYGGVRGASRL